MLGGRLPVHLDDGPDAGVQVLAAFPLDFVADELAVARLPEDRALVALGRLDLVAHLEMVRGQGGACRARRGTCLLLLRFQRLQVLLQVGVPRTFRGAGGCCPSGC